MLFKESVESLEETPLKVQKTITNVQLLASQSEEHIKTIEREIGSVKCDVDKIISSFLLLEEKEKEIGAHLSLLHNFINEQTEVVDNDCSNFDELVSKSAIMLRTSQISEKKLGGNDVPLQKHGENAPCYCRKNINTKMIACGNANCPVEWFHLSCVGLMQLPTGKWYCRECKKKM